MKLAIIDLLGLVYNGDTLRHQGLGGSESAVVLMSSALTKLGFDVTVYCNCDKPAVYDGVTYIDHSQKIDVVYDILISSRSVYPFFANNQYASMCNLAKYKVLWMHDTFCQGDEYIEQMIMGGFIDEIYTLSDFHSNYILNATHGPRRNFEVLKHKVFQTRNGAVKHKVNEQKNPNLFVYNASATKGLVPLITNIWPEVKKRIPEAELICIGGFYRSKEPDEQEKQVVKFMNDKPAGVTFTGVIPQYDIATILARASFMLYPTSFPETFGISSLESLLYNTPIITSRFGALEETAIDLACYKLPYACTPNSLFPNIDETAQCKAFIELTMQAYSNKLLLQQKQNYCEVINDIYSWDTIALQWKQHIYDRFKLYLSVEEYRNVDRINTKVARVFGRKNNEIKKYTSYGKERRIVIVSPFYNAEKYIKQCIDSVQQQDYDNYLHVLINDASTDNSNAVASEAIKNKRNVILINNSKNIGAIANQLKSLWYAEPDDIILLLDGDDSLVNNNTIFHMYNDLFNQDYDFVYGSCWSIADNIPLIAQSYPDSIQKYKMYRQHQFNWGIPYTHLRAVKASVYQQINKRRLENKSGSYAKSGGDNPLFYELIEHAKKPLALKEIICNYNDVNPLNDYKVNSIEQTEVAKSSTDLISVIIPTMWRAPDYLFETLNNLLAHSLVGEILLINNDTTITPTWNLLNHPKLRIFDTLSNIFVNPAWNLGVRESKYNKICLCNDDIIFDINLIDKIYSEIVPEKGAYGLITGEAHFNHPPTTDGSINFMEWAPGINLHGFGQLMFMHKSNWTEIPDTLKIYFGDDFILKNHLQKNKQTYLIYNINFKSVMAATTKDITITGGILEKEFIEWQKLY